MIPLEKIPVPEPKPDAPFATTLVDRNFFFPSLKALLGAADFSKAGDRNAGLAAPVEVTREAARHILSGLTLAFLHDHPLTDDHGRIDDVMRVNYAIDRVEFDRIATLTLGELKNYLLRAEGPAVEAVGRALTGVMAAALAKLCDTHELIAIARKIHRPTRARTQIGLPGTLSSRLQPNHPTDDPRGVALLVYAGLSLGSGDAIIGLNPAVDTVESTGAMLRHLDALRRRTGAPTQICVLSHVRTQMECLRRGDPVEILFQSLAGTGATLTGEFDVTIELLDAASALMHERGPIREAQQFFYFETGQGSEFTYGKHHGIDMATTEALCYGLARRYDPFMVNNVTGFIGPETHLDNFEMIISNLQDHFMGKLLGLPMGMAPCYTLHSQITLEGQQMATQLLAAAGSNFYMDVCLNTDRMLAYFDTSGHDDQTLREIHGRTPAPEYLDWAITRGIFARGPDGSIQRGPHWGDPRIFCESDAEYDELRRVTPSFPDFTHAGPRPAEHISRELKFHQAAAREAIASELDPSRMPGIAFREIATRATSKAAHLNSPILGALLGAESRAALGPETSRIQIAAADGLSAEAIHHNVGELVPVLLEGLAAHGITTGQPLLARYGRVKLAEDIAALLDCELVILLIGERPGGTALASRSLSAYLCYRVPSDVCSGTTQFEYSVISNIYSGGLPPLEAASVILEKSLAILHHRAAGNRLEELAA